MGVPSVVSGSVPLTAIAACWLVVNATETLAYVSNNGSNSVSELSIDSTGALTLVGAYSTGAGTDPADVAISPDGLNLYVVNAKSGSVGVFTINSDGSLTRLASASGTTAAHAGLVVK